MNLQLSGRKAIVCAADTDLGLACAEALAGEGVELFLTAANPDAAERLTVHFPAAASVHCDITTAAGREQILGSCPAPDILINHAPGPPAGNFRDWRKDDWLSAIEANMLAGIALIGATLDGMNKRGFGRVLNITSQSVRAPMKNLDLSNATRAGLTGFVAGVAREARDGDVTINNLLPGLFDTKPLADFIEATAARDQVDAGEVTAKLLGDHPLRRLGTPEEFGSVCAFLCSPLAAYINAQNILIDGGKFPGVV